MVTGASSFGALSGLIAGHFLQHEDDHQDELRDLTAEVVCLRKFLEEHGLPSPSAQTKIVEDQRQAA